MIQVNTLEGYERVKDRYYCTKDGTIHTKRKNGTLVPLKPAKKKYLYVTLALIEGGHKEFSVHRIICTAFIPNPQNKPTVNHKNYNKHDNRVENLEWATYKEQIDDEWSKRHYDARWK